MMQARVVCLLTVAVCGGCSDAAPPLAPTPSTTSIAGNYNVLVTALPPGSCLDANGRQVELRIGVAEGVSCVSGGVLPSACGALTQTGEAVTMVGRSLITTVELAGTKNGNVLTFNLKGWSVNAFTGDTWASGTGTAAVQGDSIIGTFTGDLTHATRAINPIVTSCPGREHALALMRVTWDP